MHEKDRAGLQIGHPAPHRHRVSRGGLAFALGAAPAAWLLQLLAAFAVTSYVCFTGQPHVVLAQVPGWLQPLVTAVNLVAAIVGIAALLLALSLLRVTGDEHRQRSGGVLDAGEGRTRFMAILALFGAAVFVVAMIANTMSLLLVPLCRA